MEGHDTLNVAIQVRNLSSQPKLKRGDLGSEVKRLLADGIRKCEIVKTLGCSKGIVAYHARRIGIPMISRPTYDWDAIGVFHTSGHSVTECEKKFGFCRASWHKARTAGRLIAHREFLIPLDQLLIEASRHSRSHIKKRVLAAGLLQKKCYECGLTDWRGKSLSFNLDHINGVNDDYRLENLRLVCPNCDSQSETWGGRNKPRLKVIAA